ncbi:maleylpyruvate isomerase family mycothiol-dependent enzyme [Jatrophihabitans sp.]|uniref:maleylpyruvate isomerase family mycothiol-dependent enzyme n=1 Tax=Jatrophihabitans sp. TaxID=1932789 RepID=UPI002C17F780|nr:maleylpyruvate isomerase family mycothiol-dependent enzyme [Jatrophihabitans sp.]
MDAGGYLDELQLQGRLLRSSAHQCPLSAAVPSCPGWTVARLLGHVTRVHRWAVSILRGGRPDAFQFSPPEDEAELFDAYDAGLAQLLDQLLATPDRAAIWTITPAASAKLFWARRLAHETAIHRVDAQLAAGFGVQGFEPAFAVDGIEELLTGSGAARFDRSRLPGERSISLTPLDSNASWTLLVGPQLLSCRPQAVDDADLSVFGLASDLYCWAWNRAGTEEVSLRGDLALADLWRQDFRVNARAQSA